MTGFDGAVNRRVLMIAYHFPPMSGSSGIQRTLRFVRYLREFGWEPVVLSAHPRAYQRTSEDQLSDIPGDVPVIRAPAWDASRHFAIAGRYPGFLARPDPWISWWLGAVPAGLRAIRRLSPQAIWSTYPVATAHCIGATLAARSGLPWVADFRDPMAQQGYPADPAKHRSFVRVEKATMQSARACTFTTPGAAAMYRERYPDRADRLHVLENGYDEEVFAGLDAADSEPLNAGCITLLHSGVVYPKSRDPRGLLSALARLRDSSPDAFQRLRVRFRAPVHEARLDALAREHGVSGAVEILPPLGYRDALAEMLRADGLVVLQASDCNQQVPAKLYEYFRARRPLLVLTDPAGDTAGVARDAGIQAQARLDDPSGIATLLERFLEDPRQGTMSSEQAVLRSSRRSRAQQLATLLYEVTK